MSNTIRSLLVKAGVDLTGLQKGFSQMSKELKKAGKEITAAGKSLTIGLTVPALALGGIAVKSAIDFESAFAGVRKTVNATEQELEGIKQGIIDMSKEIPSSTEEISKVAEAAGQLGIKSKDILGFSRVMIDLGNTTNLSADQAATELARLANITGMLPENYSRLGSTIVALGNNMATTEAEISAMSLRLAGAGKQVGMTEPQILGLAAALSSVGIEAEAGGSAMSKVMSEMQLAVSKGGKELEQFAAVAGMSADEFKTSFKNDASAAILTFIKGLGNMKSRGMDAITVLDNMGITEIRMRDALLRASGAGDLFNQSIKLGVDAWKSNTAMTKEAGERYKTTESQLKILKNQLMEVARTLGTTLMPVLKDAIIPAVQWFGGLIADLVKWFQGLSPEMQKFVGLVAGLAVAMGPLLTITGKIVTSLSDVTKGLGAAIKAIQGGKGLMGAITALLGPAGLAVAAISAITLVAGGLAIALGGASEESIKLSADIKKLKQTYDEAEKTFEDQNKEIATNAALAGKLSDELYSLNAKEKKSNAEKARMNTLVKQLNEMYPELNMQINKETGLLDKNEQTVKDLIATKKKALQFEAQEKRILKLMEAQAEAQDALNRATIDLTGSKEKMTQADIDAITAQNRFNNIFNANLATYQDAKDALDKITESLNTANTEYDAMAQTIISSNDAAKASVDELAQTAWDGFNSWVATKETEQQKLDEYNTALDAEREEQQKKIDEYNQKIEDTTNTHISEMGTIYDKGIEQRKGTTNDVIKNLKKQIAQFKEWRKNIKTLSASVPPDVMAELIKLGPEAAPLIADLVKKGDPKLTEFINLMREKAKVAKNAAIEDEAMGGLAGEVAAIVDDVNAELKKTNEIKNSASKLGAAVTSGFESGMNKGTSSLYARARSIARQVINEMKSVIKPGSPSKVTTEFGKSIADGLTVGIGKSAKNAIFEARSLAVGLTDAFSNIGTPNIAIPKFNPAPQLSAVSAGPAAKDNPHNNMNFKFYLDGRELTARIVPYVDEGLQTRKTAYGRGGGIR